MDYWVSLSPLAAFLAASVLVLLGVLAGRYAGGRRPRETREATTRAATIQDMSIRSSEAAKREEPDVGRADQMSLHEWDGGPPRPNWNRQKNLNVMS